MTERRFIKPEPSAFRRRLRTRRLSYVWPFMLSVEAGEIFKNLPPDLLPKRVRATKRVKKSTKVARVLIKTPL